MHSKLPLFSSLVLCVNNFTAGTAAAIVNGSFLQHSALRASKVDMIGHKAVHSAPGVRMSADMQPAGRHTKRQTKRQTCALTVRFLTAVITPALLEFDEN